MPGKVILSKAVKAASELKKETRKQVMTAIIAAFGLVIALAWKDAINEYIKFLTTKLGLTQGTSVLYQVYAALLLTFFCVIGIVLITRWLGKKDEQELKEKK